MLEILSKDLIKMKEEFKKKIAAEMTTDDAWPKVLAPSKTPKSPLGLMAYQNNT